MTHIEYFKNQAKKLLKDWKAREQKHFATDIKLLFRWYNVRPDEEPTLMKAQHLLAQALGRNKWDDLLKEPEEKLAYTRWAYQENNQTLMEEAMAEKSTAENTEFDTREGYHGEVECLHCGQRFPTDKPNHLPSCDGEDWDLVPVDEL